MADDSGDNTKSETAKEQKKKSNLVPGQGKPKGGTRFPRIPLEQALKYSTKLVSKTAIAPQTEATILAGVIGNSSSVGKIKASALKQYGLMEGTAKAHTATQLAKDIDAAADENERLPLIRQAMLTPKVFRDLFDTYHGDEASKGKIRSRTQQLEVHPDSGEECAELFMASAETAKLGTRVGDGIRLKAATDAVLPRDVATDESNGEDTPEENIRSAQMENGEQDEIKSTPPAYLGNPQDTPRPRPRTAADVTVNLTVDSSLDGDKLGKQLELLRRFGLI
jgi:hypothetical protein